MCCFILWNRKENSIVKSQDETPSIHPTTEKVLQDIYEEIYDNPSAARNKAHQIIDTIASDNKKTQIVALKHIGSSYAFETNYPEAINYYLEALKSAEEINFHLEIANINNNLGTIFNELGNYKTAFQHFSKALENYEIAKAYDKKTGTLNNIGLTHLNLKNYNKALSYFNQALHTKKPIQDSILIATILNNIAICEISNDSYDKALKTLNQSINLSENINNQYGLAISHQIKGNLLLKMQKNQEAYQAYKLSQEIAENAKLDYQTAVAKIGIARVLLDSGKTSEALSLAQNILELANNKDIQALKSPSHLLLSEVYQKQKSFEKSLEHYQEHIKSQQELVNETIINQIHNEELNQLDEINKLQHLELEKKELTIQNKNTWIGFLSILFILALIGIYFAYRTYKQKQKIKFQNTVIQLTQKKSHAAIEAEIKERKRIGEELHDRLGYLLSLAGLQVSVLQKRKNINEEKRTEIIQSLTESINEAFEEVRSISHNLAPSLLSERGLQGALKSISDKINQTSNLEMNFDIYGLDKKLDDLIENVLYKTIQEIVNNTIKHAQASELFIQITQDQNEINLIAEDNGIGFDQDEITEKSSFGLNHIRSAIENLNGSMHIDSKRNRGTIITILIPIKFQENYGK